MKKGRGELDMFLQSIAINQPVVRRNSARELWKQAVLMLLLALFTVVFCSRGQAQAGIDTGIVTGIVKDQKGALVAKAQCVLSNVDTGVGQTTETTDAGAYTFPYVGVGNYSLKVTAPGFKESQFTGIVVHLGSTVTQDVKLQVGAVTQEISVTSSAPLLQAQDASLGMTVDSTMATELPLFGSSGGRNFMTLTTIAPGVQFTGSNSTTGTFLIHGVQSGAVDVRLNGADDNAEVFGGITIPPIPDTIQEFKLQTGNNPAELGHSYGTVVNVVTKTGTNKFKGSVWEYNENDMYNANDYFNKLHQLVTNSVHAPNRPGRFKENSFGGIYGGPVIIPGLYDGHNKTFFTADFQWTYYTSAPSYTGTVPTQTMQQSNFSNLSDILTLNTTMKTDGLGRSFQQGIILDPGTTRAVPAGTVDPITGLAASCPKGAYCPTINGTQYAVVRDPFLNSAAGNCPGLAGATLYKSTIAGGAASPGCFNQLPAGRLDPNALALLKLFPGANTTTTSATGSYSNNFFELLSAPINTKQYDVRIDHAFNDKDSSFLTWSHYNQTQQQQPPYPGVLEGGGSTPFWTTNPTYVVVLTETHVFDEHLVNEVRLSDEHNWNTRMDPGNIDNTFGIPAQYGIQGIPQTTNNGGLPTMDIGGGISEFGSRTNVTWQKVGAWQFSDNLTKIVGRHTWKVGGEYTFTYGNIAQLPWSRGHFSYGQYSNVPNSGDGGPGIADFLLLPNTNLPNATYTGSGAMMLSTPTSLLGGANGFNGNNWALSTYHAPYISFYASDSWKITPSLTATLGIRYEYFGPYASNDGQEGNFWMGGNGNQASGTAFYIAHDGCATTTSTYFKNLMAYDNIPIICEPNNAANKTPKANWAPRLGLAWRMTPHFVARAGVGVAYGAFNSIGYGGTLGTNYPFRFNVQNGPNNAYTPQLIGANSNTTATMENTFGIIDMTSPLSAYMPLGSLALYGKPYHFKIPYVETLDFALQWQFTNHDSIQATYVGNLGRQLESANPYHNAVSELLTPSTSVETLCATAANPYCATGYVPFPNLAANAGPMENTGQISNYHSVEVEYEHQFAAGFNMDANYTFARCWTDTQGGQQNEGGPGNGRAPWATGFGGYRADYDRCTNLAAHIFKLSGEYGLPFGRGAHWASNVSAWQDAFIGGWKLDPIWIASSGVLSNVGCGGTIGGVEGNPGFTGPWFASGTAMGCNAPMVSGVNPYKPGPADQPRTRITGYWNSTAFTAPANPVQTNGQMDFSPLGIRGNQIYGPGWYDVDLSLHKQFKTSDSTRLEFGAMAINAFNHVQLNNPGSSGYANPNESLTGGWGTITGDHTNNGDGRVLQFVGKFFF
jgi:hypothetical protein